MALFPIRRRRREYDPFDEFERLQKEMNRLFDFALTRRGWDDVSLPTGQWTPSVDVYDKKDAVVVKADLPGVDKNDIDVSIEDNVLTIKGEKKEEKEEKKKDYVRTERFYGSFYRAVELPVDVDPKDVKAKYKNGVLEINIPKKKEAQAKTIDVKVE